MTWRAWSEIFDAGARLVDDHQRVDPHVPLRVPLGFLRAPDQGLELGEQPPNDPEVERQPQTCGRSWRLEQELFDFSPDPLGRQIVERNALAQRPGS